MIRDSPCELPRSWPMRPCSKPITSCPARARNLAAATPVPPSPITATFMRHEVYRGRVGSRRLLRQGEEGGGDPALVAELVRHLPPDPVLLPRGIEHHAGIEVANDGGLEVRIGVHPARLRHRDRLGDVVGLGVRLDLLDRID